jgi:hypothetical protein
LTFRCGLFQDVLDEGVQGFPLIHGIAYKALVELGIKAKIEGALDTSFSCLLINASLNSRIAETSKKRQSE